MDAKKNLETKFLSPDYHTALFGDVVWKFIIFLDFFSYFSGNFSIPSSVFFDLLNLVALISRTANYKIENNKKLLVDPVIYRIWTLDSEL